MPLEQTVANMKNSVTNAISGVLSPRHVTVPDAKENALQTEPEKSKQPLFEGIQAKVMEKAPAVLAELIGTFLLVCLGCMGCIGGFESGAPPSIQLSLSFGMVVMFCIQIFGSISGAHFNPAVTLAAVIWRLTSPGLAVAYVLAQVLGSWLGFGTLRLVTPTDIMYPQGFNVTGVCSTVPHHDVSSIQALIVEFVITAILILVTCSCWDPVNSRNTDSIPIKFGFTIAAISMLSGPYTGASMNPARSIGPAIWNSDWRGHWIYWVGPLLSSLVSTLLYRMVFLKPSPKPKGTDLSEELPLSNELKISGV